MKHSARITGTVQYREGDGVNIEIRPGACEIEVSELDATISWTEGQSHGSTVMPLTNYKQYLANGAIQLDEPQTL